ATGVARAQATTETQIFTEPVEFSFTNPCTGEEILLTGTAITQIQFTQDPNGVIHSHIHSNGLNVTGTGVTSGTKYVLQGTGTSTSTFSESVEGLITVTTAGRFQLTSRGAGDNFAFTFVLHQTFTPNGVLSVDFFLDTTECLG